MLHPNSASLSSLHWMPGSVEGFCCIACISKDIISCLHSRAHPHLTSQHAGNKRRATVSCFRVYFRITFSWQDKLLNLIPSYLLLADLPSMGFKMHSKLYGSFPVWKSLLLILSLSRFKSTFSSWGKVAETAGHKAFSSTLIRKSDCAQIIFEVWSLKIFRPSMGISESGITIV